MHDLPRALNDIVAVQQTGETLGALLRQYPKFPADDKDRRRRRNNMEKSYSLLTERDRQPSKNLTNIMEPVLPTDRFGRGRGGAWHYHANLSNHRKLPVQIILLFLCPGLGFTLLSYCLRSLAVVDCCPRLLPLYFPQ